ncbi:hypothetical protein R1sor_026491 [Riccia sorocarpa]|uniref:Uncharacterized protein n=1 Tax=Riccia sorocarpa TaxID=122646 RepID=A0ABD3GBI3_9MARC
MPHQEKGRCVTRDMESGGSFHVSGELSSTPGSTEDLLGCIAASFSEDQPRKKRFHIYKEIALVLGYAERTALPLELELAVKLEFSEPGETFTGFKE